MAEQRNGIKVTPKVVGENGFDPKRTGSKANFWNFKN